MRPTPSVFPVPALLLLPVSWEPENIPLGRHLETWNSQEKGEAWILGGKWKLVCPLITEDLGNHSKKFGLQAKHSGKVPGTRAIEYHLDPSLPFTGR